MSTFERIYQTDPAREADVQRENISTALSDQEYLLRLRRDQHALDCTFGMRKPVEVDQCDLPGSMKRNLDTAKSLLREDFNLVYVPEEGIEPIPQKKIDRIIEEYLEEKYAKSQSKSTPRKSKKDHPKPHAPAVESVQEKL